MLDDRIEKMVANKINTDEFLIKYNQYEIIDKQRQTANKVLTNFRLERTRKELPKTKVMSHFVIDEKMRESAPGKIGLIDVLMNDKANLTNQPKLSLPPAHDKLWVLRPIGKYVIIKLIIRILLITMMMELLIHIR